jgi:uncharacterized protein YecE (DUF72 family)
VPVVIGASGWQYRHWRDTFYPKGVAQKRWLEFYAERFQIVEVNNSFYHLPKPETFTAWAERTPDDFIVGVKASRYLTHIKRLKEPQEPVERFMSHARNLGSKLGPILVQLPPNLQRDTDALAETLDLFGRDVQVTVEFRHDSWFVPEVETLLRDKGAALSFADRNSRPISPLWKTAEWGYLRFHHGLANPIPCYGRRALKAWAERLADMYAPDDTVYVFFNNDPRACALRDAYVFAELCEEVGLEPTRVPAPEEVTVDVRVEADV